MQYFNVSAKAGASQLNLPHGTNIQKVGKEQKRNKNGAKEDLRVPMTFIAAINNMSSK